jgi:hypothetical protein
MLMRLLRITVALSAALTPLVAETAFSRPMPVIADFPRASNPQVNEPVCFIETPSGTTFDLVSLCGTNADPPAPNNATPGARNPANAPANAPNANNPAATPNPNAVTRDAAGTPITTPAGTANPANPANPNNVNPGTAPTGAPNVNPTGTPNNANPGTAPTGTPNVNPNNTNPGTAPTGTPNNANPGTAGDGLVPNTNINLPRVPPSSGPGGVAPTRDAIDGPRNQ